MTTHASGHLDGPRARDEPIVESLVVPFAMVVLDVFRERAAEVPVPAEYPVFCVPIDVAAVCRQASL
jgi:hypothetical protein